MADAVGFFGGQSIITTRRFDLNDSDGYAKSIFCAPGLTHINIFVETEYTGRNGGPFNASGTAYIDLGIAVRIGMRDTNIFEEYATIKTVTAGSFPSDVTVERYVASIPISLLELEANTIFSMWPRVRIVNSNFIDGGSGDDPDPLIRFNFIRIVTSSYSIAGYINSEDGISTPLSAILGEVL